MKISWQRPVTSTAWKQCAVDGCLFTIPQDTVFCVVQNELSVQRFTFSQRYKYAVYTATPLIAQRINEVRISFVARTNKTLILHCSSDSVKEKPINVPVCTLIAFSKQKNQSDLRYRVVALIPLTEAVSVKVYQTTRRYNPTTTQHLPLSFPFFPPTTQLHNAAHEEMEWTRKKSYLICKYNAGTFREELTNLLRNSVRIPKQRQEFAPATFRMRGKHFTTLLPCQVSFGIALINSVRTIYYFAYSLQVYFLFCNCWYHVYETLLLTSPYGT